MTGFGRHRIFQLLVDAGIVALSWFLAFQLRFDQGLPPYYDTLLRRTILLVVAIKVVVFLLFGFHRRWWRYVSVNDIGARRAVSLSHRSSPTSRCTSSRPSTTCGCRARSR